MAFTVLVATTLNPEAMRYLVDQPDLNVVTVPPTLNDVTRAIREADALILRDELPVDAALLSEGRRLKVIGRAGVGLAGIDMDEATARGIMVMITPGANAIATGEHTMGLMLALCRQVIPAHNALAQGQWERQTHIGLQLSGKTLGLIGLGRVGRNVAVRAEAFDMRVLAYDPYVLESQTNNLRVKLVGLEELYKRADIISIHCAATPETSGLIDAAALEAMKPGVRIINAAHGSIIDEVALIAALQSGKVAGAALDVFANEPTTQSPLFGMPNVVHTPHIGDSTVEAQHDLSMQITEQVVEALRGKNYRNAANMPFTAERDFESMQPYLKLAEKIGTLHHYMKQSRIRRVAVEYRGEELEGLLKPLSVALIKGMFEPVLGENVNYINAPLVIQERGIALTQTKGLDVADYSNMFSCQVHWEVGGSSVISGVLFNRREPRIVQIDEFRTDFVPEGTLLIFGSYDVPGVIGQVGTLMAEHRFNIGAWRTGRARKGGETLTVLTLDQPLSDDLLAKFRKQEYVRFANQVTL